MITLATLNDATAQEVFDQVAMHLLTQGKRSILKADETGHEICAYRSPDGLKCAAGCLISDSEYKKDWEGHSWDSVAGLTGVEEHAEMISHLQFLHDYMEPSVWREELRNAATKWALDTSLI